MKKDRISRNQKLFSCIVYILNILMLFFPWIAVGDKRYNIFQMAAELKGAGIDGLAADASLFTLNTNTLKVGIGVECGLFFMFLFFAVMYMTMMLRNRKSLWNAAALFASVVICMWNTSGDTISALNTGNMFMWCFPAVFLMLCGMEFIAGKAMEQWSEMNREAKELEEKNKAQKKEERERLEFSGKYNPMFYQFLWKNFIGIGLSLMLYSMFEYRQLRNFENPFLLCLFFIGLYLTLRHIIVEYLLRETRLYCASAG